MSIYVDSHPAIRRNLLGIGLILTMIAAGNAGATLISSAGDTALVGALVEDFDGYSPFYFASQSFLSGADGFTVRSAGDDRALIDNFAFVPVPEPSAGLLAGLGLVGLASVGRRTRNPSQNGIRA